jgi:hypothetical protein
MAENPAVLIANFPKRKTLNARSANLCTSVPADFTPLGIPTKQKSRESHLSSARLAPIRRAPFAFLAAKASLALPFQQP